MTHLRLIPVLILLSYPASAKLVKPEARCGPAIPRESVTVLDISDITPEAGQEAIRRQFGEISVVRTTQVQARTALGRAWKRAEADAAELGCPFVVLTQRGKVTKGFGIMGGAILPAKRDAVEVLYAMPAPESGPSADPEH